jgi:hypothetical protein
MTRTEVRAPARGIYAASTIATAGHNQSPIRQSIHKKKHPLDFHQEGG